MRILFVSEEVAPFSCNSEIADLVRMLPEQLQETGDFEVRIMMPRYGVISERRNRLHEVIRLSGNEVEIDARTETLKVKVASIPGIRLQVYFMDNSHYFKRKGIHKDKEGVPFNDNAQRALFFSKSVLHTIHNLGWTPDIVHCFGWMSSLTPLLLRTEFSKDPIFEKAKSVYTPGMISSDELVSAGFNEQLPRLDGLNIDETAISELGSKLSDMVLYGPSATSPNPGLPQLPEDMEEMCERLVSVYEQVMAEVTV